MYSLKVEKRNELDKARKLRKAGLIPGSIYGGDLKETLLIQIPEKEANKLLKEKSKGGNVILEYEGKQLNVLLKDTSYCAINSQVEDINFQSLVEGEVVTSVAQVVLLNKNKVQRMVQQLLKEVTYKALPSNLVEKIELDLTKMRDHRRVMVKDLSIFQNSNVEVLDPGDTMVLSIAESAKK